jgi:DNA polymerase-3 subunit gamma/tau
VFILATTEVHKIPATILSRCMRFDFRLVSLDLIAELIMKIYDEQGKEYEKEAIYQIAKAGEGSIRDALSIADTALSYSNGKLTFDEVTEILGSSNTEVLINFLTAILNGESGKVLDNIENFSAFGKSIGVLIKDITRIIRDLIVIKTCNNALDILKLPKNRFEELSKLASAFEKERLIRILEIFAETETSLRYSTQPRIVFETASIKASRPDCDYDYDALLARFQSLESAVSKGVFIQKTIECYYRRISSRKFIRI